MFGSRAKRLGRRGEWIAMVWYILHGYRLRHRNWRAAGGELDLVLSRGRNIIFVEVKSRSSSAFGGASAAVTLRKQRVIIRTAAAYLSRYELWDRPLRFDVLALERRRSGFLAWDIRHIPDAFHPDPGIMAG